MLIIRKEQQKVLSQYMRDRFEKQLCSHLRSAFSQLWADKRDEEVLAFVRNGIKKAFEYDIRTEYAVRKFVSLMCADTPDFDRQPWVKDILSQSKLSARHRMDRIYERMGNTLQSG